jgi:membrane-associated phospholipid phosphatase
MTNRSTTAVALRRPPLVPWPRAALTAVVVATVLCLGFGLVVRGDDHGLAVDNSFHDWILRSFDVYTRFDMVQLTDRLLIVLATGLVAGFAVLGRRVDIAVLSVAAPLVATGLTEYVLKPAFDRTVPQVAHMTGVETKAYPSGHEAAVSSVLVVLALLLLRSRLPVSWKVCGVLGLVAYYVDTVFGLVGQYYHYLTDTIGALAVAIAVVLGLGLIIDRMRR